MTVREASILLYEELFKQVTLNKNFRFREVRNESVVLDKFVAWVEGKYGDKVDANLMMKYFEFQFSRYVGFTNKQYGSGRIMITWLIGPKAIKEWESRSIGDLKYRFKARKELYIRFNEVFKTRRRNERMERKVELYKSLNPSEESAKARFLNIPEGFLFCQTETTLYHPESKICNDCKYKEECKNLVRTNLGQLAKARGFL